MQHHTDQQLRSVETESTGLIRSPLRTAEQEKEERDEVSTSPLVALRLPVC